MKKTILYSWLGILLTSYAVLAQESSLDRYKLQQYVDYIAELEVKVESLENDVARLSNFSKISNNNRFDEKNIDHRQEKVEALLAKNKSCTSSLDKLRQNSNLKVASLETEIKKLLQENSQLQYQHSQLESSYTKISDQNKNLINENKLKADEKNHLLAQLDDFEKQRSSTLQKLEHNVVPEETEELHADVQTSFRSRSRQGAFTSLKEKLAADINNIERMLTHRSSMIAKARRQGQKFNYGELRSSSGKGLSELKLSLHTATSFSQLAAIQKDIINIDKQLRSDLKTVR